MEDPVLSSYLLEFSENYDLQSLTESDLFEFFAAYCVFHRDFSDHVELDDVVVSGTHDTALDAIGIFLNEIPITSDSQVSEIAERQKIDVDFGFVQAKTSKALKAAEIGSFIQGVKEFFGKSYMPANEDILSKRSLSDAVFRKSVRMRRKPKLSLYYAYAGSYKSDANIVARVSAGTDELRGLNLFSEVEFHFLDADKLQERYQEVNLRIEREITINEFASLPPIEGVKQAYLGVLPCVELVSLLSNSDGNLHRPLFNENVRDFLSRNPVNDEIEETLRSSEGQGKLAALNNGITIVAKEIKIVGKKFTLSDYQIVNGCQTSHIVFENRGLLQASTSVPVKIIQAENRDIVNDIVRATNRQTEVKDEAFVVLGDFHKRLERFFQSQDMPVQHKLVYERRKRQYSDSGYTSQNIITITFMIKSFVSVALEDPVDAIDYYGVLLQRYGQEMFVDGHSLWPYLVSAMILKEVERLCVGNTNPALWKFRLIVALLVRRSLGRFPEMTNEKAQASYAEKALDACLDRPRFIDLVRQAEIKIANEVNKLPGDFDKRNAQQNRKFVEGLLAGNPAT